MSKQIFVLMFPNQEKDQFVFDYAEPSYSCMRCAKTTSYSKHNLSKILRQLQEVAGKNEIAYPIDLAYTFFEKTTEEVEEKHLFSSNTKKVKHFGDVKLFLHFNKELSDDDIRIWTNVVAGVFATMKALN